MNNLKEHRMRQGLSVRALAAKAGVDPSAVSLLENDRRKAQQNTLSKLAAALDVPPETFADLLDTSAAERGRLSQHYQAERRKHQQSQTLTPTPPPRPARSRKQPKGNYWVFDDEGTSYGSFIEETARRLKSKLTGAYICQAVTLQEAGEQYRRDLTARSRGQHPAGFD